MRAGEKERVGKGVEKKKGCHSETLLNIVILVSAGLHCRAEEIQGEML